MQQTPTPMRFGAYVLTAHLGRGGMADVYRARREGAAGFERSCVVKRILTKHSEDPHFVDMFINEAKIAARLTHPNIVQVYELGELDGEFFMALEYVRGKDLLRVLRAAAHANPQHPSLPQPVAAYIAREMCRGLQHAHDHTGEDGTLRPIIHRDVSPQNVMVSYDGQVKLVDFGIAKALDSMKDETRTGALKGKFSYMSPEQIEGQTPGPNSDVFAVGIVLHEMLTGRRLFKGATDFDTLSKVRSMVVSPPSALASHVSPELDQIVLQALRRDRRERYQKASAMARDLDVYLQSARFSVEDMSEYLARLLPIETREEPGDSSASRRGVAPGPGSSSRGSRKGPTGPSGPTQPSGPRSRGRSASQAPATKRSAPVWLLVALSAVVAIAAVAWALVRVRRAELEQATVRVVPMPGETSEAPIRSPSVPASTPSEVTSSPTVTIDPSKEPVRSVRLESEPAGAQVYEGPRLVGSTPIDLPVRSDAALPTVTLVSHHYRDLTYTLRPEDFPTLTLRMTPVVKSGHGRSPVGSVPPRSEPAPPPSSPSASPPPTRPRVEVFDDGRAPEPPGPTPKVRPIDE